MSAQAISAFNHIRVVSLQVVMFHSMANASIGVFSQFAKRSNSKSFRERNLPSIVIGTAICNLLPSKVYLSLGSPRQTKTRAQKGEGVCEGVVGRWVTCSPLRVSPINPIHQAL